MADINVRAELFQDGAEMSNKHCNSQTITKIFPVQKSISSGTISGDLVFEFNTGNSYLDLFKTHLMCKYTTGTVVANAYFDAGALVNMFSRGTMYIDGRQVCFASNWSQQYMFSERVAHGGDSLVTFQKCLYKDAASSNTYTAGAYSNMDVMYLSGFFIRKEDQFIPPNRNVRIVFNVDSNWLHGALLKDTTSNADIPSLSALDIWMNSYQITTPSVPTGKTYLRLANVESFQSTMTSSTSHNIQYTVKDNLIKLGVANQYAPYTVPATGTAKVLSKPRFRYDAADASTYLMTKLNLRAGDSVIPSSGFDNTTYGQFDSYQQYLNAKESLIDNKIITESYADWLKQGPIYLISVVHNELDKIQNVESRSEYLASTSVNHILFPVYEQVVEFEYNNGIPGPVTTLL